jgi:hypothetical protein
LQVEALYEACENLKLSTYGEKMCTIFQKEEAVRFDYTISSWILYIKENTALQTTWKEHLYYSQMKDIFSKPETKDIRS